MARSLRQRAVRFAVVLLLVVPIAASAQSDSGSNEVPRTSWGTPDLQGIWDFRTTTPLERPETQATQAALTGAAAVAFAQGQREAVAQRLEQGLNADWIDNYEVGLADGRTALIVDPSEWKTATVDSGGDR